MNTIFLSEKANVELKKTLTNKGFEIIEIKSTRSVYSAVSSHADIYLCKLDNELIVAMEQLPHIQNDLICRQIPFTVGESCLEFEYPGNIKYNAAQLGNYLIHNSKYTDGQILSRARELGLKTLHVKQGYSKCNIVIVDENAAITSDAGIASALVAHKIQTLIVAQGHVKLEGFPYGFLGGASGRVRNEIFFNGDLSAHPDFIKICEFIRTRDLEPVYFKDYPLEDIGSIIQL